MLLAAPTAATAAELHSTLPEELGGSYHYGDVDRVSFRRYTVRNPWGWRAGSVRRINADRWAVHAAQEGRTGSVRRFGNGWITYERGLKIWVVQRSGPRRWTIREHGQRDCWGNDYCGYVRGSTIGAAAAGAALLLMPR